MMIRYTVTTFLLVLFSLIPNLLFSQLTLQPFVLNVTAVTDITNCGDDRIFITEQKGKIFISDMNGNLNPLPFLSITGRVTNNGERGLLGMAFGPNYITDKRFYV